MSTENVRSNRGTALLAELKALVDSFPSYQRKDLILICERIFRSLNAGEASRHSPAVADADRS